MKQITLPQFGMGMTEGLITKWHKSIGDSIEEGELLCEVEIAKTTVEMQAPCSGTLTRILVPADRSVPVNTCLALVDESGSEATPAAPSPGDGPALWSGIRGADPAARTAAQVEPRARNIARAHNVDLGAIQGSGPGGRIVEEDVIAFVSRSR